MSKCPGVDIAQLAVMTDEMTGADVKAICTEAGMFAITEGRECVTQQDFREAIAKVKNRQKDEFTSAMFG